MHKHPIKQKANLPLILDVLLIFSTTNPQKKNEKTYELFFSVCVCDGCLIKQE